MVQTLSVFNVQQFLADCFDAAASFSNDPSDSPRPQAELRPLVGWLTKLAAASRRNLA